MTSTEVKVTPADPAGGSQGQVDPATSLGCDADAETAAVFEEIMNNRRFLEMAGRDIATLEVTARELEDMVNHAEDYRDDYFDVSKFVAGVEAVWGDRREEDRTSSSPKRTVRLFPTESAIMAQRERREQLLRDRSLNDRSVMEQRHPLMYRRVINNEERRRAFNEAMTAYRGENTSDMRELLALRDRDAASPHRTGSPSGRQPLGGYELIKGVPSRLQVSADATKVLQWRTDASALLSPAPARALPSSEGPTPAFSGSAPMYKHEEVLRAARAAQQQARERRQQADQGVDGQEQNNGPEQLEDNNNADAGTLQSTDSATGSAAGGVPSSTGLAHDSNAKPGSLAHLLAEQRREMALQEKRHSEEYVPLLERFLQHNAETHERLIRLADMVGMSVPGQAGQERVTPKLEASSPPPL